MKSPISSQHLKSNLKSNLKSAICILQSAILPLLFLSVTSITAQPLSSKDQSAIKTVFKNQLECWNKGNIPCFMEGYWRSDSLKFIGSKGLTYGWQPTLDNYKKSYPDPKAMGKLTFSLISMEKVGRKTAFVIGKWHLAREAGDLSGHFSLIWKKMKRKWVIVADHSS